MALRLETDPALMLNQMIMACKKSGRLSIVSCCTLSVPKLHQFCGVAACGVLSCLASSVIYDLVVHRRRVLL